MCIRMHSNANTEYEYPMPEWYNIKRVSFWGLHEYKKGLGIFGVFARNVHEYRHKYRGKLHDYDMGSVLSMFLEYI